MEFSCTQLFNIVVSSLNQKLKQFSYATYHKQSLSYFSLHLSLQHLNTLPLLKRQIGMQFVFSFG